MSHPARVLRAPLLVNAGQVSRFLRGHCGRNSPSPRKTARRSLPRTVMIPGGRDMGFLRFSPSCDAYEFRAIPGEGNVVS